MTINDCRVGMRVFFGRETGEKTTGTVVKINGKKAKVRTDESRGKFPAGSVWSVPYSMLEPLDCAKDEVNLVRQPIQPIEYSPFQDRVEQLALEAIACCYNGLSPENLSCDGEAPMYLINQKRAKLNKQLKGLFAVIGREVDEMTVYNWLDQKRSRSTIN